MASIKIYLPNGYKMLIEHPDKTQHELIKWVERFFSNKSQKARVEKQEAYFLIESDINKK